ncbi:hypothetical protein K8R43_06265 [archaeon]|nr:hypothetical protein [archaeon]
MSLFLVLKGWINALVELVKGIFWIALHPLTTVGRIIQLITGSVHAATHPKRVGGFLKSSPYEPYKAMTLLAVVGAIGIVSMGFINSEPGIITSEILLTASGIAYLLWRSKDFYQGRTHTADGIDGFILLVELMPLIGGLAVISRLAKTEGIIARVEGTAAKTGRLSKSVNKHAKTLKPSHAKTIKSAHGVNVIQPTLSVGEWATHWIKISDELTHKFFRPLKDIGKRIKR